MKHVRAREAGDERIGGLRYELCWGADLKQTPLGDDRDPIGEGGRVLHVVCDEDCRQAELGEQLAELGANRTPSVYVERRQRLVEEKNPWISRERASERDPLPLPS